MWVDDEVVNRIKTRKKHKCLSLPIKNGVGLCFILRYELPCGQCEDEWINRHVSGPTGYETTPRTCKMVESHLNSR